MKNKKCKVCQAVDELAPSMSYCSNHDYPTQPTTNQVLKPTNLTISEAKKDMKHSPTTTVKKKGGSV
jgi:hypothetical protein